MSYLYDGEEKIKRAEELSRRLAENGYQSEDEDPANETARQIVEKSRFKKRMVEDGLGFN